MSSPATIPFFNRQLQHQKLLPQLQQAVQSVLDQEVQALGESVAQFERTFAQICGVGFGVGLASDTDALSLGLQACGIGRGDEVILPANCCVGTLLGVLRSGATPVLVDCHLHTGLIDLFAAEKAITTRTRAIVCVHLHGQMASPRQLLDLASTYDLVVFEEASQAALAEREGYRAGTLGSVSAFGFNPEQQLGGFGDSAIVVTQVDLVAETLRSLRNYGAPRPQYHTDLGTSSRMDAMQAALLHAKLPYLSGWTADRQQIAAQYQSKLASLKPLGIVPMVNESGIGHVYHRYGIQITSDSPINRTLLQLRLAAQGIQTAVQDKPCHLQPAFRFLGYEAGSFPQTECLSREVLLLPIYPGLSSAAIDRVVTTLQAVVSGEDTSVAA